MDKLSAIRRPVEQELAQYKDLFDNALAHEDDFLGQALAYVRQRKGKMMRPILVLLMAKELGVVKINSLRSAVTLELLHTASLVHDDVVDESGERRGQRSVNAVYDNKVAVLVGDYLLSTSLLQASKTGNIQVVEIISHLGGTLSEGEVAQLANIRREAITEEAYFHIIHNKTAALFAACAELGAISAGGSEGYVKNARKFGEIIGICFQIRDDIFDYYADSEYVGEYFKCRKFITGFTGSAGRAVIMEDMAGLWTDGRYFIQAAAQLEGTGVELFKMGEPDVPTVHQFLEEKLGKGMCLGFDGRTVSAKEAAELSELLEKKGAALCVNYDLVGEVWEDRPELSCEPVMELDVKWAGESRADKCARIRKAMEEKKADAFVLTSLDDIAWLLNIRGGDVHCCPVVLSYLVMTKTQILLFANEKAFPAEVKDALAKEIINKNR